MHTVACLFNQPTNQPTHHIRLVVFDVNQNNDDGQHTNVLECVIASYTNDAHLFYTVSCQFGRHVVATHTHTHTGNVTCQYVAALYHLASTTWPYCFCNNLACSQVTAIDVRSLALLQDVRRAAFNFLAKSAVNGRISTFFSLRDVRTISPIYSHTWSVSKHATSQQLTSERRHTRAQSLPNSNRNSSCWPPVN
jgi:hypothetical protein